MSEGAGVMRTEASLRKTMQTLSELSKLTSEQPEIQSWEASNLHLLATAIVNSALTRKESRGSHWRSDYPNISDEWLCRITGELDPNGKWKTELELVK
jgi:L-aspartate oxidase